MRTIEDLRENKADKFAGAFVDDQGTLNINLVKGVSPKELYIDDSKIKVHYVEYSYKELNDVFHKIELLVKNQAIQFLVAIDEKENKIIININQGYETIEKLIRNEIHYPFIEFRVQDSNLQFGL